MNSVCLIITTYNHAQLFEKSLLSIANQTVMPDEIIFTDDGSSEDIISVILKMKNQFNCKMTLISQPHIGFRAAKVRNNAVKVAKSKYLIFLDHDILITPGYLETHIKNKQKHRFLVGLPIRLSEEQSLKITAEIIIKNAYDRILTKKELKIIHKQYFKDYYYYLETKWLRFDGYKPKLRAGVFSIFKDDFLLVDGFDERFIDCCGEDDDLGQRLSLKNIYGKNVFYNDFPIHLFHPPNRMEIKKAVKKLCRKESEKRALNIHGGISNPIDYQNLTITEI